uniref:Major facilitator superfamily (MFS) profile domain-containing protein n=1 Tax=Amphimedon queenslandica TaxID=400682 RepID=A0A1X7TVC1_AMPQE
MSDDSSVVLCERGRHRKVKWKKVPLGAWILSYLGIFNILPAKSYRLYILILTFICYASYHMSRKPFSVVASVLAPNCNTVLDQENSNSSSKVLYDLYSNPDDPECHFAEGWPPFNGSYCKTIIGAIDYAWLFTYATFMIGSGFIADRVNLRYFLTIGMTGSGLFVGLLGIAYFADIHNLTYYVITQIFVGIFESTGWPATVAVMGNWFGKKNRGLLMGIWNSHASVGNILGTAVPSIWGKKCDPWGWAFLVPAFVMIGAGLLMFFFLVLDPRDVGLPPPQHHDEPMEHHYQSNGRQYSQETSLSLGDRTVLSSLSGEKIDNEKTSLISSASTRILNESKAKAVSLWTALTVPGVIEFSVSLFFAKLVAYTFLFWLPYYVAFNPIGGRYIGEQKADLLATLYDVGGIIGGITTGALSDVINARAISCVIMMYLAVPTLFMYRFVGNESVGSSIVLIIFCGLFINGPYALITTAVSNDLGTHESLRENQKAKATVGAIIDGMGSLGAAFGPLVTGFVSDYFVWLEQCILCTDVLLFHFIIDANKTGDKGDAAFLQKVKSKRERLKWPMEAQTKLVKRKLPLGGWLLSYLGVFRFKPSISYRAYILILTFLCYTSYHMSRKPFSVVANVLAPDCNKLPNASCGGEGDSNLDLREVNPYDYVDGWPPFNTSHCKTIIGAIDYSWLFTYAVFLVLSGLIADRVNLRYFLTVGMIGSGIFVSLLGVAYYANVHHLAYFIFVQIFVGIFESTGWPGVVAVMGNWFGKKNRGLLMGVWNSHTSVGNILGTAVPSIWARKGKPWGWSFLVPGLVMIVMGIVIFLFLIVDPAHVGLPPPKHHLESASREEEDRGGGGEGEERYNSNGIESLEMKDRTHTAKKDGKSEDEGDDATTDNEANGNNETSDLISRSHEKKQSLKSFFNRKGNAISLLGALKIPGVIEFALALFFAKLVAYTFLFWLPYYVAFHPIDGSCVGNQKADLLATLYDVGGIIGGITTGALSDVINARAISCVIMMYLAVPTLFLYRYVSHVSLGATITLILLSGLFINGPYALITTAVSNDLVCYD